MDRSAWALANSCCVSHSCRPEMPADRRRRQSLYASNRAAKSLDCIIIAPPSGASLKLRADLRSSKTASTSEIERRPALRHDARLPLWERRAGDSSIKRAMPIAWRGLMLARGTEGRRATAKPDRAYRRSAHSARPPLATVHEIMELEVAGGTVAVNVVPQGASALCDRVGQRLANGLAQSSHPDARDAVGGTRRANTGAEQRLVGVDVADANDHAVIHKSELDRSTALARGAKQMIRIELRAQGLGPESGQQRVMRGVRQP